MVLQRLATGSIRITQNALKSLSPGGAAFADLRPPMPQELGMATAQLFAMVPKSKSLLDHDFNVSFQPRNDSN